METAKAGRRRWLHRLVGTLVSVGGHALILLAIVRTQPPSMLTAQDVEPAPISLTIMGLPPPGPPAETPASPPPTPEPDPKPKEKPTPPKKVAVTGSKPVAAPKNVEPAESSSSSQASFAELPEGALAGAATAAEGPIGGDCNMPRLLQNALRRDRRAQAAVARVHRGKALLVWDGSWVRSRDEDGDGLAGLREAIMVEVAFAPAACKSEPVRGLVLLSMGEGGGRVVLGQASWRWQDLLGMRTYGR